MRNKCGTNKNVTLPISPKYIFLFRILSELLTSVSRCIGNLIPTSKSLKARE